MRTISEVMKEVNVLLDENKKAMNSMNYDLVDKNHPELQRLTLEVGEIRRKQSIID